MNEFATKMPFFEFAAALLIRSIVANRSDNLPTSVSRFLFVTSSPIFQEVSSTGRVTRFSWQKYRNANILTYFISFHLISSHFISFHLISSHFISFHLISSHFISFHHFHLILFGKTPCEFQTLLMSDRKELQRTPSGSCF